jgi:hypothetical protein
MTTGRKAAGSNVEGGVSGVAVSMPVGVAVSVPVGVAVNVPVGVAEGVESWVKFIQPKY